MAAWGAPVRTRGPLGPQAAPTPNRHVHTWALTQTHLGTFPNTRNTDRSVGQAPDPRLWGRPTGAPPGMTHTNTHTHTLIQRHRQVHVHISHSLQQPHPSLSFGAFGVKWAETRTVSEKGQPESPDVPSMLSGPRLDPGDLKRFTLHPISQKLWGSGWEGHAPKSSRSQLFP